MNFEVLRFSSIPVYIHPEKDVDQNENTGRISQPISLHPLAETTKNWPQVWVRVQKTTPRLGVIMLKKTTEIWDYLMV